MGELTVLNEKGDERIEWDPADAEQVAAAQKEFKRLKKEGYNFYEISEAKGQPVKRFSKGLGKLIAAPGGRKEADKESGARPRGMSGGPLSTPSATVW